MTIKEAVYQVTFANGGVYAEKGNRWFKVYGIEPDGTQFVLEAGYEMMPADYSEEHENIDAALASLSESVAPEFWTEAEF